MKYDLVADENGLQSYGDVTGGSVKEDGKLLLPSQIDQEVLDHLPDDLIWKLIFSASYPQEKSELYLQHDDRF